jgi:hypothetical protein
LTKIWNILDQMRQRLGKDPDLALELEEDWLPEPLPPPEVEAAYNTRMTRSARDSLGSQSSITVIHPSQMVPVVNALVEAAIRTDVARDALEDGTTESKEIIKQVRDKIKAENDRWDVEREAIRSKVSKGKDGKDKDKDKSVLLEVGYLSNMCW